MRILIGGGTGFIGTYLRTLLAKKGHEAILLSRTSGNTGNITWSDIKKNGLPQNIDAVVNLSGHNLMDFTKRFNDSFKELLQKSRIDTTALLAKAINEAETPPSVFVCASAIGIYPPSEKQDYTEDYKPPDPASDYMVSLVSDWERAGKILKPETDCRHVIVRIGLVLGRKGGMIQQLYMPFWCGVGGPIGSGKQWFPWIHAYDVAGIIEHSIVNKNVTGVLNAVAPCKNTNMEFTKAFGSALSRPAFIPVPPFALSAVYGSERTKAMTEGQCVIPKRTLESGYVFMYQDLQSAFSEIVAGDVL